jgi:hypothetical protein
MGNAVHPHTKEFQVPTCPLAQSYMVTRGSHVGDNVDLAAGRIHVEGHVGWQQEAHHEHHQQHKQHPRQKGVAVADAAAMEATAAAGAMSQDGIDETSCHTLTLDTKEV